MDGRPYGPLLAAAGASMVAAATFLDELTIEFGYVLRGYGEPAPPPETASISLWELARSADVETVALAGLVIVYTLTWLGGRRSTTAGILVVAGLLGTAVLPVEFLVADDEIDVGSGSWVWLAGSAVAALGLAVLVRDAPPSQPGSARCRVLLVLTGIATPLAGLAQRAGSQSLYDQSEILDVVLPALGAALVLTALALARHPLIVSAALALCACSVSAVSVPGIERLVADGADPSVGTIVLTLGVAPLAGLAVAVLLSSSAPAAPMDACDVSSVGARSTNG